jgi:ERCC4-type nuclease
MRFFWKIVLLAALPTGGYWLYKKCSGPTKMEIESEPREEDKVTSQTPHEGSTEELSGVGSNEQMIEELSDIDGVTSRVAENLVEMGITSKEALMELTEEELRSVKGIGPKRAAKIMKLK